MRLITRLNIGGPANQALLLTKELRSSYPTVLGAGRGPINEGTLSDPGVEVRNLPLTRPLNPGLDLRALREVRSLIGALAPQIVHTHMAKAGAIGRAAALSTRRRPVLVHTFHGHVLRGYFEPRAERMFVEIERWLARHTDALIAVSEEVKDELLDLGVGDQQRFHVIPLGFDLAPLLAVESGRGALKKELGIDVNSPLIGVLGRLAPIKDHATLLRAMTCLERGHLVILGDGELRGDLEQEAASLGISGRVHFLGWRHDVASIMSDLDALALTSRNEGTPVSVIEALAAGVPVVVTDVGGVRSVVHDGRTGFVVPPGDAQAVAARLSDVLENPTGARRMAEAGRVFVAERFHKDRLTRDITGLYEQLLDARRQRRG